LSQAQEISLADIPTYTGRRYPQAAQGAPDTEKILHDNDQIHRILIIGEVIHQNTRILDIIQTPDQSFIIGKLIRVQRSALFNEEGIMDHPVSCFPVHLVEHFRAEILKPFGGVGKRLLKSIGLDDNMPDHLAFVREKRAFTLGVDRGCQCGGIDLSLCYGIPEELEDIIIHYPVHMPGAAICPLLLTEGTEIQQTASNQ
jgi:hypothetical protein